jgi:hypothetical protein
MQAPKLFIPPTRGTTCTIRAATRHLPALLLLLQRRLPAAPSRTAAAACTAAAPVTTTTITRVPEAASSCCFVSICCQERVGIWASCCCCCCCCCCAAAAAVLQGVQQVHWTAAAAETRLLLLLPHLLDAGRQELHTPQTAHIHTCKCSIQPLTVSMWFCHAAVQTRPASIDERAVAASVIHVNISKNKETHAADGHTTQHTHAFAASTSDCVFLSRHVLHTDQITLQLLKHTSQVQR